MGIQTKSVEEYHVEIVMKDCPESIADLKRVIARSLAQKKYRFLIKLEGPSFYECVDLIRSLTQEFLLASFTVVDKRADLEGRDKILIGLNSRGKVERVSVDSEVR